MRKITEKMNNNYCVYMHIFPNNKKYIGITSLKPKYRWSDGKGYKKQNLMYRAILKYGWKNIKHEILYTNLSETEAKKKEIELIEKYKSNDENYGYNQTLGGEGTLGLKLSQERKEKLSKLHLGIPRNQETKRKISESEKGKIITKEQIEKRKATMKKRYPNGFKQSDEMKNKISIRMLNNKYNVGIQRNKSYTDKISIKVMCVETGEIFNSVIEASRKKISTNLTCIIQYVGKEKLQVVIIGKELMNTKNVVNLMIHEFNMNKLKYDFAGYTFERTKQLSFHHLRISKHDCKLLKISSEGYLYWNGAILRQNTSHDYLHLIQQYDEEIFELITKEMIKENEKGRIDIENLRVIRDLLLYFEKEHSSTKTKKGKYLIKESYIKDRIIL